MNWPTTSASLARAIERFGDHAGLLAEEIVGDEVERGRGLFIGDRRPDPSQADAVDEPGRGRRARAFGASVESNGASIDAADRRRR